MGTNPGKKRGPKPNSPAKCMAETRRAEALKWRARGLDYDMIAARMGIDRSTVGKLVKQSLNQLAEDGVENAEEVRRLELSRLDKMLAGLAGLAEGGDTKAVEAALKIMDRRAKLLGLDRETKAPAGPVVNILAMTTDELVAEATRLGLSVPQGLLSPPRVAGGEVILEAVDREESPAGLREGRAEEVSPHGPADE